MNRALLSLSPEFFPLIKSMWMSPQLRSKTIPLTSSDLSSPSMRSLQFNWGVYSIHTVTWIVKKGPGLFFISQVVVVILDASQKRRREGSASKDQRSQTGKPVSDLEKPPTNSKATSENVSETKSPIALPNIYWQRKLGPNQWKHKGGLGHTSHRHVLLHWKKIWGAIIENENLGKAGRCWWKERQSWGIWSIETQSMSGMYTMLPLTQVLRAGEKKENPGKKRDRGGVIKQVLWQEMWARAACCWTLSCSLSKSKEKQLYFVATDGNNVKTQILRNVCRSCLHVAATRIKTPFRSISYATFDMVKSYFTTHMCYLVWWKSPKGKIFQSFFKRHQHLISPTTAKITHAALAFGDMFDYRLQRQRQLHMISIHQITKNI